VTQLLRRMRLVDRGRRLIRTDTDETVLDLKTTRRRVQWVSITELADLDTGEILFDQRYEDRAIVGEHADSSRVVAGIRVKRWGRACAAIKWAELTPEHVRKRARAVWVMTQPERRGRWPEGLRRRNGMPAESSRQWRSYWATEPLSHEEEWRAA
jgi:hypothetical protein